MKCLQSGFFKELKGLIHSSYLTHANTSLGFTMNFPSQIPTYISHPIHAIKNNPSREVIVAIIKVVDMALLEGFAAVGGVAVGVEGAERIWSPQWHINQLS